MTIDCLGTGHLFKDYRKDAKLNNKSVESKIDFTKSCRPIATAGFAYWGQGVHIY